MATVDISFVPSLFSLRFQTKPRAVYLLAALTLCEGGSNKIMTKFY